MRYSILLSLRETLLSRSPIDTIPESVWKRTGALNTWGTNAIEGNALTRRDVERLLLEQRSVANRPVPDVLETLQHETAFRGLLQRRAAPLRRDTALELHRIVFQTVLPTAGAWRRVNVGIAGARFTPPRMERVPGLMEDWEREYSQRDLRAEDVFSLGATLYSAVEGQPPFGLDDNAIALLFRITTSEIAPPERAGPLAPVLTWALDRDPAQRPPRWRRGRVGHGAGPGAAGHPPGRRRGPGRHTRRPGRRTSAAARRA